MKQWRCTVCDYIAKEASAPEKCPVCGSESSLFVTAGEGEKAEPAEAAASDLRWQCTVCGYIHTGPEPPDKCPVCGVDSSKFVCLDLDPADTAPAEETPGEAQPERKWRCTICGYIHTGSEPPQECPLCGADQSLFEEVLEASEPVSQPTPAAAGSASPDTPSEPLQNAARDEAPQAAPALVARLNALLTPYRHLIDLAIENHAHPISVHIPNGVLPIAVVMVLLASLFDMPALGRAGFYNMVFILLSMPVVLFTGYLHWQYKFGGQMTSLFKGKLISGAVVSVMALILVIWALIDSRIAAQPSFLYLSLHIVMLGVAAYAGYLGGRLVFHRKS
jgi:rubrerythrin/uncharacterized membrane protein